jgi:DNA replicative helicase MCM subunit Mcm2 (Cdc46/Mcm family)
MAEASAKMHLREYVRADDVDLAISVAVGSFLSAQKLSVRRSLERVSSFDIILPSSLVLTLKTSRDSVNIFPMPRIMKNC